MLILIPLILWNIFNYRFICKSYFTYKGEPNHKFRIRINNYESDLNCNKISLEKINRISGEKIEKKLECDRMKCTSKLQNMRLLKHMKRLRNIFYDNLYYILKSDSSSHVYMLLTPLIYTRIFQFYTLTKNKAVFIIQIHKFYYKNYCNEIKTLTGYRNYDRKHSIHINYNLIFLEQGTFQLTAGETVPPLKHFGDNMFNRIHFSTKYFHIVKRHNHNIIHLRFQFSLGGEICIFQLKKNYLLLSFHMNGSDIKDIYYGPCNSTYFILKYGIAYLVEISIVSYSDYMKFLEQKLFKNTIVSTKSLLNRFENRKAVFNTYDKDISALSFISLYYYNAAAKNSPSALMNFNVVNRLLHTPPLMKNINYVFIFEYLYKNYSDRTTIHTKYYKLFYYLAAFPNTKSKAILKLDKFLTVNINGFGLRILNYFGYYCYILISRENENLYFAATCGEKACLNDCSVIQNVTLLDSHTKYKVKVVTSFSPDFIIDIITGNNEDARLDANIIGTIMGAAFSFIALGIIIFIYIKEKKKPSSSNYY